MKKIAMFLLAFSLLAGCAAHNQDTDTTTTDMQSTTGKVVVVGRITSEGVECLAMRSDDNKLYTLGNPQNPPAVGTRVRVTGTIAEISTCMQGTTINVEKIEVL